MDDLRVLFDPTDESQPIYRLKAARPVSLTGLTVGLLDISKPGGDIFLMRIEELLHQQGIEVRHYRKPTYTRVAPTQLCQQIADECDLAVEGLAD